MAIRLSAHAPPSPADLIGHNCIRRRFPSGRIYRWEFARHSEAMEIDVPGTLTLGSDRLMIEAALAGVGIAYLSEFTIATQIEAGRLVPALGEWIPASPGLALYYPGHRHMTAGLRAFIDLAREQAAHDRRR
jgi:DNA-binding transcriptional LysR family regulator